MSRARKKSMLSMPPTRSFLYQLAGLLGDVAAVKKGRVGQRIARRAAGKAAGRILGRLFK